MFDSEYVFRGKHADMVKRLTAPLGANIKKSIFETNYDVYAVAPFVGYLYIRTAEIDHSSDANTKIFVDKMMNEAENLKYNYRILMLLIYKDKTQEEKTKIAFKLDKDDEARAEYDKVYDSYVRGGVEILSEKIFADSKEIDGYIMNMYNFMNEFNNRYFAETVDIA